MKKLLMGVAALSLLTAGAASAETIVKRGPNQTTVVHKDRYGDKTVTKFNYKGRTWNRVRGPAWSAPPGWAYRRWTIGLLLPRLFFSAPYYYDSWWEVGLEPPPPGYRWLRYGPDLLLVNVRTHRIADVVYNAFY